MKTKPLILKVLVCLFLAGQFHVAGAQDQEKTTVPLKIEIKHIDAQKALIIKADVPTSEVGPKMGEMYGELFSYLGQNQINPVGPPFAVYYSFDPQGNTIFEAGVPGESGVP